MGPGVFETDGVTSTPPLKQLAIAFVAIVVVIGTVVGSTILLHGCGAIGPSQHPGTKQVHRLRFSVHDAIGPVDFVVDRDEIMHLVFEVSSEDRGVSRDAGLWYQRGNLKTGAWEAPRQLSPEGSRLDGNLRLLSISGSLHLLFGSYLRHMASADGGSTWAESDPMMNKDWFLIATHTEAEADSGSLVSAFFAARYDEPWHTGRRLDGLWFSRWTGTGVPSPILVERDPDGTRVPCAPRLLFRRDGIHILYLRNRYPEGMQSTGAFYHAFSKDRGRTWSKPDSCAWPEEVYGPPNHSSQYEFDASTVDDKPLVFVGNWALHAMELRAYGTLSHSAALTRQEGILSNARVQSINTAGGHVVWIDERYGIVPLWRALVLHPYPEANNDVLVLPIARAMDRVLSMKPLRLTRDRSKADFVRAHATAKRVYVVWSGRTRVGDSETSAGKPPTIFYATLPLR